MDCVFILVYDLYFISNVIIYIISYNMTYICVTRESNPRLNLGKVPFCFEASLLRKTPPMLRIRFAHPQHCSMLPLHQQRFFWLTTKRIELLTLRSGISRATNCAKQSRTISTAGIEPATMWYMFHRYSHMLFLWAKLSLGFVLFLWVLWFLLFVYFYIFKNKPPPLFRLFEAVEATVGRREEDGVVGET